MAEETTEGDSDIDLYCDLEETGDLSEAHEECSDANDGTVSDIKKLFSENECKVFFSEDGNKTKIKIKKQVDNNEDATNDQSVTVKDLDLFTDVVTEKFVQAEQEKLERESLISQNIELKKLNSQLEAEINMLMKKNRILTRNICALYRTAKEEVSRKDAMIADLREKNDGMIFRRRRFLGAGTGGAKQFSKFQGNDSAVTFAAQRDDASIANSCAGGCAAMGECNQTGCKNLGQNPSSDISAMSSFGNTHRHNSERRKKLPKAFQDPEKHSRRRHLLHKSHGKSKRPKTSGKMYNDSEESSESHLSRSRLCGYSSESDAGHLFQETLRELKKSRPLKRRRERSVLSKAELRCIYSDYQRSLDGPRYGGQNVEKEKSFSSTIKDNMNCDSEEATDARNNLFKKLLSYERQDALQEMEMKQKNVELKRIISSSSNVDDFTQQYSKYLAQWALQSCKSSGDTNSLQGTSGLDDSDEQLVCGDENGGDYPDEEDDYEDDYDDNYEYYSGSRYVDLDKPNDNFYGMPRKSFHVHVMEEKASQAQTYCGKDYQRSHAMDPSKAAKQYVGEETLSASQLPEALRSDSLKLFSYQRKSVPIAVKKKVLGYAKSPKKATVEKENNNNCAFNISTFKLKNKLQHSKPS